MRRAAQHFSIGLFLTALSACNQILGIAQGHYPDGGPSVTGADASGSVGGSGAGGSDGTRQPEAGCVVSGTYAETETPEQDPCGISAGKTQSTLVIRATGSAATISVDGTELAACPATVSGCDLHWDCTNASTGVTLSADLNFDASGFTGTVTESQSGCSVGARAVGTRR